MTPNLNLPSLHTYSHIILHYILRVRVCVCLLGDMYLNSVSLQMAAGTEILISFAKLLGDTEKVWTIQRGGMRCKHHDDDDSFFADMLLLVLLLYPLAALLYHLPIPSKLYRPSLSPHLTALNPALLNFSISTHYVIKEHTHNILGHHIWGWWWWRWWAEQKQNRKETGSSSNRMDHRSFYTSIILLAPDRRTDRQQKGHKADAFVAIRETTQAPRPPHVCDWSPPA